MDDSLLDLPTLVDVLRTDSDANKTSVDLDEYFAQANQSTHILKRCERVRAKKAGEWLNHSRMVPDLVQVIVGIGPNESYLHFLLKEHAETTWTGQYGLAKLPLVQLAQLYKSPAVKVLDEYWRLQTTPPSIVLAVLTNWPGIDMSHETTFCFQMLLDMTASVWRRQVRKHQQFPWLLAALLDPDVPQRQREDLLSSFFALSPCCLEPGTALPLKQKFAPVGLSCLDRGSTFQQTLLCMFSSKSTNVELENNFARSSSARAYVRGRKHTTATLSCKHILSELKHQHLLAMQRDSRAKDRKRKFSEISTSNTLADQQTGHLTDLTTSTSMTTRQHSGTGIVTGGHDVTGSSLSASSSSKDKVKVNGWSLCLRDCFTEPAIPGETKQERYRRLRRKASERQQNAEWKQYYSKKAKEVNKDVKKHANSMQHLHRPSYGESESCGGLLGALQRCGDQQHLARIGPWGAGDVEYPVAQRYLSEIMNQPNFIRTQSKDFSSKHGALVDEVDDLTDITITQETFCMKLGGCYYSLGRIHQQNVLNVLRTLRDLARMHRGRKKSDPALMMLLTKRRNPCDDDDTLALTGAADQTLCYMVTQVTLSPLQVCLLQCTVSSRGIVTFCQDVVCYKSFTATLDCSVVADSTHTYSQTMPKLQTMHQMAFGFRHNGFDDYVIKILDKYEVISLNSVCVVDADLHFTSINLTPAEVDPHGPNQDPDDDQPPDDIQRCMDLFKNSIGFSDKKATQRSAKSRAKAEPRSRTRPVGPTAGSSHQVQQSEHQPGESEYDIDGVLANKSGSAGSLGCKIQQMIGLQLHNWLIRRFDMR